MNSTWCPCQCHDHHCPSRRGGVGVAWQISALRTRTRSRRRSSTPCEWTSRRTHHPYPNPITPPQCPFSRSHAHALCFSRRCCQTARQWHAQHRHDLGIALSTYYVQPSCSPTRATILTGRKPVHTGINVWIPNAAYGRPTLLALPACPICILFSFQAVAAASRHPLAPPGYTTCSGGWHAPHIVLNGAPCWTSRAHTLRAPRAPGVLCGIWGVLSKKANT